MVKHDIRGYIVVETVGAFILFTLLVASILSLVNVVVVQARIHYAMTQSAETLSMYCYVLEVTGAADKIQGIEGRANEGRAEATNFINDINEVIDGIQELDTERVQQGFNGAYDQVEAWVSDPKEVLSKLANVGLSEAGTSIMKQIARGLLGRYLANGELSGDEYLKKMNVIDGLEGLEFGTFDLSSSNDSKLLTADGDVQIIVTYQVEYKFGALPLPFRPRLALNITQSVKTKAWLGGDGDGYIPAS